MASRLSAKQEDNSQNRYFNERVDPSKMRIFLRVAAGGRSSSTRNVYPTFRPSHNTRTHNTIMYWGGICQACLYVCVSAFFWCDFNKNTWITDLEQRAEREQPRTRKSKSRMLFNFLPEKKRNTVQYFGFPTVWVVPYSCSLVLKCITDHAHGAGQDTPPARR